ncbi:MAG: PDZ domain-containing protein, partial [Cyclobacteriaceae bacterium]|nr:PDZ domain-containing protein [Cyclobacteriaceae bacterium]
RSIGVKFKQENNGLYVTSLIKGGSAYDNGIYVGDELISINSYRIYTHNLNSLLDQFKIGEKVTFLINRKGIVKSIELDIRKDEMVSYTYEILDNRTRIQEKVYQAWIGR